LTRCGPAPFGRCRPAHEFALTDVLPAYDTFADATKNEALKVVVKR
jgi:hypothetical protein